MISERNTPELFEELDKWRRCDREVGKFMVYEQNLERARFNGLPSSLEFGESFGLTGHEVAALLGWTTGDFRVVNPIARGADEVMFDDYPNGVKTQFRLTGPEVKPYIDTISSALGKLSPASSSQILWRGHRQPVLEPPGSMVTLPGFTSTTFDRDEAIRFAVQFATEQHSAARCLFAIVSHESGRSIAKFSARRGELEVLFPLNRRFEVLSQPSSYAGSADEAVVRQAEMQLQQQLPSATLQVVYLREIPFSELDVPSHSGLVGSECTRIFDSVGQVSAPECAFVE